MFVLLAVSDKRDGTPSPGMVPIALFFVLFAIGIAFGGQTGSCHIILFKCGHT